jgi:antitoxin component of MazEF toxin-antitoxin module
MKTDTPRTDKIYRDYMTDPYKDTGDKAAIMHIQCEKFERELAAVTEQRDAVTLRLGNTQERMIDAERQRDRLAEALRECREDSVELLGEREWWQNESRLDYQKRYQETRDNVTRADEALQSLTPNSQDQARP